MKKNWIYPLLALALLFSAGCQKTPEEAIVKGKSSEELLQKAAAETGGTLAERLDAPERYEAAFSNVSGELQVTVDADVTVPDAEAVPIIRVRPANITQAQVDVLMDKLVQGTLYDPGTPETKAEIADKIVAARQKLAEGPSEEDAGTTYVSEDGPMTYEEYMQYVIDILMEQYEAAPETAEKTVSTGQLSAFADDMMSAGGENTTPELGWEALSVNSSETEKNFTSAMYTRAAVKTGFIFTYNTEAQFRQIMDYADVDIEDLAPVTVTAEEARAMCDEVVDALDIPHMAFYAAAKKYGGGQEAPRCCWEVQYTRDLGGVPISYSSIDTGFSEVPAEGKIVQVPWENEKLNFYVNDDGIVGMYWAAPYELGETVTEDAALLPFGDVMDIFQKMFVVSYDDQDMDVTIDAIRLGYMRVSEQDKIYSGLLVPVWDFFGSRSWTLGTGEPYTFYDPDQSMLTINAIDGTIIDRSLGY